MATWRDGPEYAPLERPAAFVDLATEPLENPPPVENLAALAPAELPVFGPPDQPTPPLAQLIPTTAATRDPRAAFEVVTSTLTNQSAWASAHSAAITTATVPAWTPDQPLETPTSPVLGSYPPPAASHPQAQVNPAPVPTPGTPQWFAPPPPWDRVPDAPPPVTVAQIWTATTPGVLIPLILGAFVSGLSLIMLAASFALSGRIAYRRAAVRRAYSAVALGLGMVATASVFDGTFGADLVWDTLSGWAQFACWVLPVVLMLIVGAALRAGERPDRIM